MFSSLLIANRGEIACRVIRTAQAMGIRTIAVYSDADADALHVRLADDAVGIGPGPARDSYLVGEKIIAAAQATNAKAIHPGYGFLSENAAFAQAVIDAGLIWVGPDPVSITAMGLKDAAKALMAAAGVPVTPGYMGDDQAEARLQAEADRIGYPVLIKAVAGGGGKGMRRVDRAEDFADALASCQREALASFGNAVVLIEKYILSPRHIEVQVFGDRHGNVVHLFERDCTLQRRHQKVIEEAPAPGMDEATRAEICAAAVRAAQAVNYVGAGTIEFIADASEGLRADRIWFMEMNTRLQVEHPVTEQITGVDLVEWQLRVAAGEQLPLAQDELMIDGWAVEARLYAEDPANGFLPSTGTLHDLGLMMDARIETGVEQGDVISPFYDPMIAKLIVHADSRTDAVGRLAQACREVECAPVRTNAWFLARLLEEPDFIAGRVTTGFIDANRERLTTAPEPSEELLQFAAHSMIFGGLGWGGPSHVLVEGCFGFRLNAPADRRVHLRVDGQRRTLSLLPHADYFDRKRAYHQQQAGTVWFEGGAAFTVLPDRTDAQSGAAPGSGAVLSPMPGRVIAVDISAGQAVDKGQKLLTLEAMKMEHTLVAPFAGIVAELNAVHGQQVQVDALLARIEPAA